MPQSEKQRSWETTPYSLAGLALWLPVILARDIINQHVPAALETPLLVVVLTGSCLLGLAGFREGVYNSRPNRSAVLLGLGGGGLFFSLSLAFLDKEMGQVCGVFLAFWIVVMASVSESSSKLNARFRASFPAPATPAPVLSGEMRHFLEESATNDPDAYVIYPDRVGLRPVYRQAPYLILSRVGLVDHASQGQRGMGLILWDEIRGMVVVRREGEHTGSGTLMIILANPRAFHKRTSLYKRIDHLVFPGTSPFVNIPAEMLSVPPEDILAAVPLMPFLSEPPDPLVSIRPDHPDGENELIHTSGHPKQAVPNRILEQESPLPVGFCLQLKELFIPSRLSQ
jgi:hypothetical protein